MIDLRGRHLRIGLVSRNCWCPPRPEVSTSIIQPMGYGSIPPVFAPYGETVLAPPFCQNACAQL